MQMKSIANQYSGTTRGSRYRATELCLRYTLHETLQSVAAHLALAIITTFSHQKKNAPRLVTLYD